MDGIQWVCCMIGPGGIVPWRLIDGRLGENIFLEQNSTKWSDEGRARRHSTGHPDCKHAKRDVGVRVSK